MHPEIEMNTANRPTPPHFPSFAAASDPRRAYRHAPVAPAMSAADAAAHRAASYVRPAPTDSDPSADELLHRVRHPRSNLTTCPNCDESYSGSGHTCAPKAKAADVSVTTELAYVLRDRQHAETVAAEIADGVAA
jgi:hypothetical protein